MGRFSDGIDNHSTDWRAAHIASMAAMRALLTLAGFHSEVMDLVTPCIVLRPNPRDEDHLLVVSTPQAMADLSGENVWRVEYTNFGEGDIVREQNLPADVRLLDVANYVAAFYDEFDPRGK